MANNDKRFIEIGLKIAYYRKLKGMTQERLAECAGISTGYLSQVESPGMVQAVSLETLYALADACGVDAYLLLKHD